MPEVEPTTIEGAVVVQLERFGDDRGSFMEMWREEWLPGAPRMVQSNRSESAKGVLRGLHYHLKQSDFWIVVEGVMLVALYDFRMGAPSEGRCWQRELTADDPVGLFIPPGILHGFLALEDAALIYLVDQAYDGDDERGVAWNDPGTGLVWPTENPILSDRDGRNLMMAEIQPASRLAY